MGQFSEVVSLNNFLWNEGNVDSHVCWAVHRRVQVEALDPKAHVFGELVRWDSNSATSFSFADDAIP